MQTIIPVLCLLIGLVIGWLVALTRAAGMRASLREREETNRALEQKVSVLAAREAELSARLDGEKTASRKRSD